MKKFLYSFLVIYIILSTATNIFASDIDDILRNLESPEVNYQVDKEIKTILSPEQKVVLPTKTPRTITIKETDPQNKPAVSVTKPLPQKKKKETQTKTTKQNSSKQTPKKQNVKETKNKNDNSKNISSNTTKPIQEAKEKTETISDAKQKDDIKNPSPKTNIS